VIGEKLKLETSQLELGVTAEQKHFPYTASNLLGWD